MERPTIRMEFTFGHIRDISTKAAMLALRNGADVEFEFNETIKTVTYDEATQALPQITARCLESLETSKITIEQELQQHHKQLKEVIDLLLPLATRSL